MKQFSDEAIYLELKGNVPINAVIGRGGIPPSEIKSIPRLERDMTIIVLPDVAEKLLAEKTGGINPDEIKKMVPLYKQCMVSESESSEFSKKSRCYDFTGKVIQSNNPSHVFIQSVHNKPNSLSLSLLPKIVKIRKHSKSKTIKVALDDGSVWTADYSDYSLLKCAKNKHVIADPIDWTQLKRTSKFNFAIQNMDESRKDCGVSVTLKIDPLQKHRSYYSHKELSEMKTKHLERLLVWPGTSSPPHDWENQLIDVEKLLEQRKSKSRGLRERKFLWIALVALIVSILMFVFQVSP
ncbi:MAG: hypothetical protein OXF08_10760 [Bacteroidetes bacterium]|nr:hypothetical protein [Bacteroidota bacterium]